MEGIKETLKSILKKYESMHSKNTIPDREIEIPKWSVYALSIFRGGIGKTTIAFNLAYETSKNENVLCLDCCPQKNFTELLTDRKLGNSYPDIHDLLLEKLYGDAWGKVSDKSELCKRVYNYNIEFKHKEVYVIPGSEKLFLFPNSLYNQINQTFSINVTDKAKKEAALRYHLLCLEDIIKQKMSELALNKCVIDTSPFFSGATHLAWSAAEALIIPVRVDEQSMTALELTLNMLKDDNSDFNVWRVNAGIEKKPKVQAIVMTHCGWNRSAAHGIDKASISFIEKAIEISYKYKDCFSTTNISEHFCLLNEFHSAGKISGKLSIPLSNLESGKFKTISTNERLQVNQSINRYNLQMQYLLQLVV